MKKKYAIMTLSAAILTACGGSNSAGEAGGSGGTTPTTSTAVIKVVGGGLEASSGANYAASLVTDYRSWPEWVAQQINAKTLCSRYAMEKDAAGKVIWSAKNPGCTSYAINDHARAPLTNAPASVDADDGTSIVGQLQRAATDGWSAQDILLVGAGYTQVLEGQSVLSVWGGLGPAAEPGLVANLVQKIERLIGTSALNTRLPESQRTLDTVMDLYMAAQAERLADTIDRNALQKGVTRVMVLNTVPAYAFSNISADDRVRLDRWTRSFNTALSQRFANQDKVRVVDAYQSITTQMAQPTQYGYANVTAAACNSLAYGTTCTADALTAIPAPADSTDKSTLWWKNYMVWQWDIATSYYSPSKQRVSQRTQDNLGALVMAEVVKAGWK